MEDWSPKISWRPRTYSETQSQMSKWSAILDTSDGGWEENQSLITLVSGQKSDGKTKNSKFSQMSSQVSMFK